MHRKTLFTTLLFLVFLACANLAFSAAGSKQGMDLYKKNCKVCHVAGMDGGALTPISKTQAQWDRFFDKNRHKKKPEAWQGIPEQELRQIRQWLHDHAADSDQPETCG